MDFIKSRWSGSNQDAQITPQSQPTETSYNSVAFNNALANPHPIVIATQLPSHVSIIHEVRNPQLKAPVMTSPTDSFHSVGSTFHDDKRDGKTNSAFNGSNSDMNSQHQQQQHQATHSVSSPQYRVFHQSYWSWNWPWQSWNVREKILLLVVVILSLCVLSLTSALSVTLQKNIEYRTMLFEQFGIKV